MTFGAAISFKSIHVLPFPEDFEMNPAADVNWYANVGAKSYVFFIAKQITDKETCLP